MYKPKNFPIQELVPREAYNLYNEDRCWGVLDNRQLISDQQLRDKFGAITINNWHTGGSRNNSGFRMPDSKVGGDLSQHRQGRATDKIFHDYPADEVREYIKTHQNEFPYITFVEYGEDMNWVHTDCRKTNRTEDITAPIIFWSPDN